MAFKIRKMEDETIQWKWIALSFLQIKKICAVYIMSTMEVA